MSAFYPYVYRMCYVTKSNGVGAIERGRVFWAVKCNLWKLVDGNFFGLDI